MPTTATGGLDRVDNTRAPVQTGGSSDPVHKDPLYSAAYYIQLFGKLKDDIGAFLSHVNRRLDLYSEANPADKAIFLKKFGPPPSTPFLTQMFGLEAYWSKGQWRAFRGLSGKEGNCPASGSQTVPICKVEIRKEDGDMVVNMDRETVQQVKDECQTEWLAIYTWRKKHCEEEDKGCIEAPFPEHFFNDILFNLGDWFKMLDDIIRFIPKQHHGAASVRISSFEFDTGSEAGWTISKGSSESSIGTTIHLTHRTTLAQSGAPTSINSFLNSFLDSLTLNG